MNSFIRLIYFIFKWMPLWLVRLLGRMIGGVLWLIDARSVKVNRKNIDLCWPQLNQQQRCTLTKATTYEMAITGLELFKVWSSSPGWMLSRIQHIHNEALYSAAIEDNKAIVLVAPHLGNWEVVGLYCALQTQMTSMYAPIKQKALDDIVKHSREASGANLVPTNVRGVMAMLKALKKGEQVGILPDQKADKGSGVYSPFFGNTAYTMTLVNTIAKKSDAELIMAFAERVKGGWDLHFQAPDPAVYEDDLQAAVDGLNRSVEQCVKVCPAQYQWEYKRFSGQPDGSDPYANLNN